MNKQTLVLGVGVLALVAVGLVYVFYSASDAAKIVDTNSLEAGETGDAPLSSEGGVPIHPVSLLALMQKEFDGRDLVLGRVLDDNNSYKRHYITYKSGDLTISGIMNVPKGDGPFPVLVLNHGYIDPAIYTNGRGLKREQDYLARRGYIVIHPDYRNHAESDKDLEADVHFRLGYVEDVINAVMAVKSSELPFVDKENVGMLGHSMGGGVTLNVLVAKPDLVKAAVLFAPVSSDNRDNFERWTKTRPETAEKVIAEFGRPEENPEFWDNVSSETFLEKIATPVLLHHGTADDSVPIEWSNELNETMNKLSKEITYHVYRGEQHEFALAWVQVMERTVAFYDQLLKQ